jgi:hypothetical protein
MVLLLGAELRHEAIGFFAQFVQNAGAFSHHVRILRVFTAELPGPGGVEKLPVWSASGLVRSA